MKLFQRVSTAADTGLQKVVKIWFLNISQAVSAMKGRPLKEKKAWRLLWTLHVVLFFLRCMP
jgi:hypothetical protein